MHKFVKRDHSEIDNEAASAEVASLGDISSDDSHSFFISIECDFFLSSFLQMFILIYCF